MYKLVQALLASVMLVVANTSLASQSPWQLAEQEGSARVAGMVSAQFNVDYESLRQILTGAPHQALQDFSHELHLPQPDGSVARYSVVEAPIMQPALAQAFPQIRTYKVFGLDDPAATGRIDISPRGFYGMLYTSNGRVFIDPEQNLVADGLYLARYPAAISGNQQFSCGVHDLNFAQTTTQTTEQQVAERIPGMLREYLLAVSATEEYVSAVGNPGDVANAQAAIVTAINRVNQIYERDFGITMVLVGNNDRLIEKNGNVSFSNTDKFALFLENQCWIDTTIGELNYDIGHVFTNGGGGVARLGSVCSATVKAHGVTGLSNPIGDPFYIDYVAHEIGHQFGAQHTFAGSTDSCDPNRVPGSAMEPGSGSTIMGYSGICGSEDLQFLADATFHANSITQINAFAGSVSCHSEIDTSPIGNTDPVIGAIPNYTIPSNTAFVLSGSATDGDGDTSTYQWDQMDFGTATTATTFGQDLGDNALFRTYEPSTSYATRHFPALGTQLIGPYDKAEVLPCNSRQINLRLTARDGNSGQDIEDILINVSPAAAGTFEITNFQTPTVIFSTSPVTLQWDDAGTTASCPIVDIELLTFSIGYSTYTAHPISLGETNDGSHTFNITPVTDSAALARFRISCSNNIFYDISDADLEIRGSLFPGGGSFATGAETTVFTSNSTITSTPPVCGNPRPANMSASAEFNDSLQTLLNPSVVASNTAAQSGSIGYLPASCDFVDTGEENASLANGDASVFDPIWLLLLGGVAGLRRWVRRQG